MAVRTPAANFRRSPVWRRSGDESHWDTLISERERSPPPRPLRPQSAIEGRHLDNWLEHLQTMQNQIKAAANNNNAPHLNKQTKSTSILNKDPSGGVWRQRGFSSISGGSSVYDSSSLCESSYSSQDSLRTGFCSPPRQRGSWERAHFLQTPRKETAELSDLVPVKTGWLPVQRKVIVPETFQQNQLVDQVKLKQPITPMFQRMRETRITPATENCRSSPSVSCGKTWPTHDGGSPRDQQVTDKRQSAVEEKGRLVSWQALKRGCNTGRRFVFPGGKKSNELPTRDNADHSTSPPLEDTTSPAARKQSSPYRTSSAFIKSPTPPEETNPTGTYKTYFPLQRTSVVQPLRATLPLSGMDTGTQASHIQTSSAVTTLIPQNKTGFSSITISSRKVTRSSSLPGSCTTSRSPSPTLSNQNPRQETTHRKATIVKVTEKRVTSNTSMAGVSAAGCPLDTVVHRRKATIIKVTEHRERYTPAKKGPENPVNRHSYTGGLHCSVPVRRQSLDNRPRIRTEPSNERLNLEPHPAVTSHLGPNGPLHRSTVCLFVQNTSSIKASESSNVSPKNGGPTLHGPRRPLSCYGSLMGHTEPNMETGTHSSAARKSSFGLDVNPDRNFIKSVEREAEPVADRLDGRNSRRRPSLTLIKTPDPNSMQSPEEVLALNAAAIIANIKLQRQLSKTKKTPNGELTDVTDEGKCIKSPVDQRCIGAGATPSRREDDRSLETVSLQEALEKFRPDFISRSQERVRELERKAQQRRDKYQTEAALSQRKPHSNQSASLKDNLFRSRDSRAITGKEVQPRPKQTPAELKRKRDEDKKREICLSNRQRVELYKKRLLNQLLHRSNN